MPSQPAPDVTDDDVRRVAMREFGPENLSRVLAVLEEFGKQKWNQPSARVRMAVLKMANRDLERLKQAMQIAIEDYRDALSAAEYPRYMREVGFSDVPHELAQRVIDSDWIQYREWLEKK